MFRENASGSRGRLQSSSRSGSRRHHGRPSIARSIAPGRYLPHGHALIREAGVSNIGCYLEVIKNEKLVWTDALEPRYRPTSRPPSCGTSHLTAVIALEPDDQGAEYTAIAIHKDEEGRRKHEEMGFHEGWGKALDQLVAFAKKM
jgi:uncharacterized protein YndB with AHSA1/START domain